MIPQIGFNACYNDAVGSPQKCLAFAIIQSCAASSQVGCPCPKEPRPSPALGNLEHGILTPADAACTAPRPAGRADSSCSQPWRACRQRPRPALCQPLLSSRTLSGRVAMLHHEA